MHPGNEVMAWGVHLDGWPMKLCHPVMEGISPSSVKENEEYQTGIATLRLAFQQKRIRSTDITQFAFSFHHSGDHIRMASGSTVQLFRSPRNYLLLGYWTWLRLARVLGCDKCANFLL